MARLKEIIKNEKEVICDGIAWVVIYKQKRGWKCDYFYPEGGSYDEGYIFNEEDLLRMNEIAELDHKAICINGYYMGFGNDFTQKEVEERILWMYTERLNLLSGDFLECFAVETK